LPQAQQSNAIENPHPKKKNLETLSAS
jgi:hypothetical protein